MKKLLSVCLLLVNIIFMQAQISLGVGSTNKGHAPISTYYGYSYVQQIFTKSEINAHAAGNITGLKFYIGSSAVITNSEEWVVYIGHTTKSNFADASDWIDVTSLTEVFSGVVTNNSGEIEIVFSTPFSYNNVDNLVIAAEENKTGYDSNGASEAMLVYPSAAGSSITFKSDSNNPTPTAPPTATSSNYMNSFKSVVTFEGLIPSANLGCPLITSPANAATGVAVLPVINWNSISGANDYIVSIGTSPGGTDIVNAEHVGDVLTYTVSTTLLYNTQYYVTIIASDGINSSVGCTYSSFTTRQIPCPTVIAPSANESSVSLTPIFEWDPVDGADGYKITIGTTTGGTDVLNDCDVGNVTNYTLTTPLLASTTYFYKIIAYSPTSNSTGCIERKFETLCSSFNAPYTQSFSSGSLPGCWISQNPNYTGTSIYAKWMFSGAPDYGTTNNGRASGTFAWVDASDPYTGINTVELISPQINLAGITSPYLEFDWFKNHLTSPTGTLPTYDDNQLRVEVSSNGGAWIEIFSSTSNSPSWRTEGILLPTSMSGTVIQVKFTVDKDVNGNGYFYDNVLLDEVEIKEAPTCLTPTDIIVSGITNSGANLEWTAPAIVPSSYEVYYSTSNTAPDSATTPQLTGIASTTTPISSLTSATNYFVWVRSNCGAGGVSDWSAMSSFITQCDAVTSMYENFDSYATGSIVPTCWDRIITGSGSQSITSTTPTVSGNRQMYQYSSGASNATYVVLPVFSNINAGTHQLRFFARSGSGSATLDVGYVTDITDVSTFVSLETITFTNTTYDSNSEHSIIVPNTVPLGARLAIMNPGVSTSSHYWDDVYWEPIPTCGTPTDVAVDNITSTSADVSWVAPISSTPTEYEIYYSTSSTQPDINTVANVTGVTSNFYTITPLTPASSYYVWVRSVCSATEKSNWTLVSTFITSCVPVSAPYSNDFTVFPGACWSQASGGNATSGPSGTTTYWYEDGFLNNGFTGSAKINLYYTGRTGWLKSVEIDLGTGGSNKEVKFNYGLTDYADTFESDMGSDDVVQFLMSTDGGNTWTIIKTWDASDSPSNTTNLFTHDLTGITGNVMFAFYGSDGITDDDEDYEFFVDNFAVADSELSTSEVITKKSITVYPNPFTEVLNISEIDKVKMVVISDATGRVVKTINKPEAQLHLADLTPGMYLVTLRMKDGTVQTVKTIKK